MNTSKKSKLKNRLLLTAACLLAQPAIFSSVNAQTAPIWADEFDSERLNRETWTFTTGGDGNGNGELQYYTASHKNTYLEDGNLVIEARRESYEGKEFTSARLHTNGRVGFKYGTLEARIKLPKLDNGLWPAFWMLGNNFGVDGWPQSGEIDIMEAGYKSAIDDGTVNNAVSSALHWWHESGDWSDWLQADHAEDVLLESTVYEQYHTYRLDWTPEEIAISVDDIPVLTMDITDPNLSEFRDNANHILLNLAVGGWNFVEIEDPALITADFPAKMYVDYVRLYANEYTELEVASDSYYSGDFGIMTDTHPVLDAFDWGDKANLYIWNNMTSVATNPAEGSTVLSYSVAAGDWWGMGLLHKDYNMRNYAHGYLHFDAKVNSNVDIEVNMASTSGGDASVLLAEGGEQYGLERDGEWHKVSIPLSQFGGLDMETIKTFFSVSGPAPSEDFEIAFDNIYLTESVALEAPEYGNFGIFTETSANMTAGNFGFGVNGDLYVWDETLTLNTGDVREGNSALNLSSTGKGWFGLGLTAREGFNLTAFDNENAALHFSMRTSDQTEFRIGLKGGNVNDIGQAWVSFKPGADPYGFVRDGQWHDIVIPMSDIAPDLDLFDMRQVFQLLGFGEVMDLSIDNIYLSGGEQAQDPGTDGEVVNRAPVAAVKPSVMGGPAGTTVTFDGTASTDVNGDILTYSWDFGDGITAEGATVSHTYADNGSYRAVLTVNDGQATDAAATNIFIADNYGAAKSSKRGLGYGHHSVEDFEVMSQGISWWYNWSHTPDVQIADIYQNYGVEFVPMAWNGAFDDQAMRDYIAAHPEVKYILAFNEPNFIDQANMTPSQTAAEWPRLEAIADEFDLDIVSVAMNFCGNCVTENGTTYYDPIDYFDDFFAACPDCRVDAMSIHAYMPDVGAIEWYVDLFKKYNRPIWLTEFSAWEDTTTEADQQKLLIQTVDYLENDPDVARYAWFTGRRNGHPYNGLFDYRQSGVLTELGNIYVNMPVHGAASVHNLPNKIQAEAYGSMSGVRVDKTSDTSGFLDITETAADSWVEYNLVGKAGNAELQLRVATEASTSIEVVIDGVSQGSVAVPATGGVWDTLSTSLNLKDGAQKLRLVFAGTVQLNWLDIGGVSVDPEPVTNLALGKNTAVSSMENGDLSGAAAVDGELGTRWSSAWSDPQWISVDLGSVSSIDSVVLKWEAAYGRAYDVQVSDDGQSWNTVASVTDSDGGEDVLADLNASGQFVRIYINERATGWGASLWELEVYGSDGGTTEPPCCEPQPGGDLALNKPASASSVEGNYWFAEYAVDGDTSTRWASDFSDSQWFQVDLGAVYSLSQAVLNWEAAYGKAYEIQVSDDGSNWTTAASVSDGGGGVDQLNLNPGSSGRYVRMLGIERGTPYGYSLWSFEVY
ncbi:glycosyl hydrolase [Microbulbifer hydrolyticus]|uniref:Beta-glucanase (GH16 family)/PKD repeat protein n=1 Tax=Microbulbifer hydrolyticus TaxID=48074 RepID=A0A6P1TF18_9GAMM|nr:glycosyl hydrolase [Microbulbifer hydrolyticus]MBB5212663.1 beta-glucanase (GH16 family)/PKD repeat protein [Microbulbifer hydrolyticus]QHQ40263.1 family 16 glycosylhydrolase [Microbulbifer hydrolyticus]